MPFSPSRCSAKRCDGCGAAFHEPHKIACPRAERGQLQRPPGRKA